MDGDDPPEADDHVELDRADDPVVGGEGVHDEQPVGVEALELGELRFEEVVAGDPVEFEASCDLAGARRR